MKIRAAVLCAPKEPFRIETVDLEEPHAGEVLVKIAAVGICHSDWHLVTGATQHPMPVIAGHEGAGVVQAVGHDVTNIKVGDHVVLSWAPACGHCFYCLRNRPNLCETYTAPIWAGTMLDGTTRHSLNGKALYSYCGLAAFATHTVVPEQSCVVIRKDVPLESACLVGCAVATGVGAAIFTAQVKPGDTCVVFGCGGVGLSVIQGCKLAGASQIIAIDTEPKKIWVAKHFGATSALMASDNVPDIVRQHTNGRGADHAFEAVGIAAIQEQALPVLRPGGVLTLAGLSPMGTETRFPAAEIARKEWTIRGSYYGTVNAQRDFPMLLDLYAARKLNLDDLITRRFALEQINEGFEQMAKGELVVRRNCDALTLQLGGMTEQEVADFLLHRTFADVQDENGIDLTLIDLSRSATDRLRRLESFHAQMNRIRQGGDMVNPDLKLGEMLDRLHEQHVEFVIVGGVAASLNGSELYTGDLDVCCRMTEENMARFANVLRSMDAKVRGDPRNLRPPLDPKVLVQFKMLILRTPLGDFDLVPEVVPIGDYEQVLKQSFEKVVEGKPTRVLTLDALIASKKALARPKDKMALLHLEAVKRKQEIERQQLGLFE